MKQRKKTIYIVAAILAICVAAILSLGNETECCLCNAPTSSAPCLVDLETGDILELRLDGPSTTYGPEGLPDVETFSFIRFGSITGTKQTSPNVIALKIPMEDKSTAPALCRNCRQLLPHGYTGQYVLADLKRRELFPITIGMEVTTCGLNVSMTQANGSILLTIKQPHSATS